MKEAVAGRTTFIFLRSPARGGTMRREEIWPKVEAKIREIFLREKCPWCGWPERDIRIEVREDYVAVEAKCYACFKKWGRMRVEWSRAQPTCSSA